MWLADYASDQNNKTAEAWRLILGKLLLSYVGGPKFISFLFFDGLRVVLQLAIVFFAIVAARRYKFAGLWLLVGAIILNTVQMVVGIALNSQPQIQHEQAMRYLTIIRWLSYIILLVTLCGWNMLARRKQTNGTLT